MQNVKLLWTNLSDTATLTGGSWALPLANVKNKNINTVARSAGLSTAQTTFTIDLGSDNAYFSALALVNISCSTLATIRVQISNTADFSVIDYDTGELDVFTSMYTSADMSWKSGNWWHARVSDAELDGYTRNFFVDFGGRENRYIKAVINDTTNAAGYIDIGRLIVGKFAQFTHNYNWGVKLKWIDPSVKSRTLGSRVISEVRKKYRQLSFSLDWLTDHEAMTIAFEIERVLGVTGEVFVVPDGDDTMNLFRTSFLAQLSELVGIEKYIVGFHKTAYTLEEIL